MKKLVYTTLTIILSFSLFAVHSKAAPGDLFVLVNLSGDGSACSVLKVDPLGNLSEIVNNSQVEAAVDKPRVNCGGVGIACASDGDVFFSEDGTSGGPEFLSLSNILRIVPPGGNLELFVPTSSILAVTGENEANLDRGMALGPDGNLYTADDTTESILKATVPGGVVSTAITEDVIAEATCGS